MWNYRLYKKEINSREYVYLKETYYDKNGEIISFTEDTVTGYFEDVESLRKHHELMLSDIDKYKNDILEEHKFSHVDVRSVENNTL